METEKSFARLLQTIAAHEDDGGLFYRLIGTDDIDTYGESIHCFFDTLQEKGMEYELLQNGLNLSYSVALQNDITRFWSTVSKLKNPSSDKIVGLTYKMLKQPLMSEDLTKQIYTALASTLDLFRLTQSNLDVVKNFFIPFCHWVSFYVPSYFHTSPSTSSKKWCVYWGEIKRNESYFLFFLAQLGVNVIYINSSSEDGTSKVTNIASHSRTYEWSNRVELDRIPKRIQTTRTTAVKAQKEIHDFLSSETIGVFKPWQFEQHKMTINRLQTTLEELFILWKEPTTFRTGFGVKGKEVVVPNLFTKISGVPEDINLFWEECRNLKDAALVTTYDHVPLTLNVPYHKQNIILKNGVFATEDIKRMPEYNFHHLRPAIQELMIEKLNELVTDQEFFLFDTTEPDFPFLTLHTVLHLDNQFVRLLQNFDYAGQLPKLIIFDQQTDVCTVTDSITLGFLHKVGFDIVIITPTGYQNIEHLIDGRFFDHHKRETFAFQLDLNALEKKKKNWFNQFFK